MRYSEQQRFFMHGRVWGSASAFLVLGLAAACLECAPARPWLAVIEFGLTAVVLAISIYYTPDYLHLTVDAKKRQKWEIKIRWRVIAVALILGLLSVSGIAGVLGLLAALAWLVIANLLAAKLRPGSCALYFWITDLVLLAALLLSGKLNPLLGAVLLAAAAYLSMVILENAVLLWTGAVAGSGFALLVILWLRRGVETRLFVAAAGLLLVSALATAFLVDRAQRRHAKNVAAAMRELMDFTGHSAERVRHLWSVSNQELARNWESAGLDGSDAQRLAEWYRQNSHLYLFAISAYNLEYKRIRSNLKVLRLARGSCLDYGAGNGEIVLELARQGHRVTHYDVNGETMEFARHRVLQQKLDVEFWHAKQDLAVSAREGGFDTIFSFDVLEHLPDLPGELDFLSSLLKPGGLFVFDVPAGSTKAHPMHLNHNLGVRRHLLAKGLEDERPFMQRLPFRKEEKYFFRRL